MAGFGATASRDAGGARAVSVIWRVRAPRSRWRVACNRVRPARLHGAPSPRVACGALAVITGGTMSRSILNRLLQRSARSARSRKLAVITIGLAVGTTTATAAIVATGLDAVLFPPTDVRLDQTESDVEIRAINERQQCFSLTKDLEVDEGVIAKGTKMKCHLIHADPDNTLLLDGRVRFDTQILGVISTSDGLDATDAMCFRNGMVYPNTGDEPNRGLEPGIQADTYQIIAGGFGIQVRVEVPPNSFSDQVRVLNCCGEECAAPQL
jgi:hypothetical protein